MTILGKHTIHETTQLLDAIKQRVAAIDTTISENQGKISSDTLATWDIIKGVWQNAESDMRNTLKTRSIESLLVPDDVLASEDVWVRAIAFVQGDPKPDDIPGVQRQIEKEIKTQIPIPTPKIDARDVDQGILGATAQVDKLGNVLPHNAIPSAAKAAAKKFEDETGGKNPGSPNFVLIAVGVASAAVVIGGGILAVKGLQKAAKEARAADAKLRKEVVPLLIPGGGSLADIAKYK